MPILWSYLLNHFLRVALFCVLAFVAILLTMQLDEIAHFAALGAPLNYILLFTFYQIPYILPIAIPISCLIASLILIQRLSKTHELTALRSSGFGLSYIFAPILFASIVLSTLNFWIVSEVATQSHLTTNLLKNKLRSINPLLLLNNKHIMRLKGIYFDAMGASKIGEFASDVLLAVPNSHQQRLNLFIAKSLEASSTSFTGNQVTLLTTLDGENPDQFDHLLIENVQELTTSADDFSQLLQKKVWSVNNDYLQLPLLFVRIEEQKKELQEAIVKQDSERIKQEKRQINRSYSEILRRLSLSIAVFTFTLMGAACGINISRQKKYSSLLIVIGLTVIYLISFFIAKGADYNLALAASLYLTPHLLIMLSSFYIVHKVSRGIE